MARSPLRIAAFTLLIISLPIAAWFIYTPLVKTVWGEANPCEGVEAVVLEGRALVLGDVHFKGLREERFDRLREFIQENQVGYLILNGDFYDYPDVFWSLYDSLGFEGAFNETFNLLGLGGLNLTIYYVEGAPAHDPDFRELLEASGLEGGAVKLDGISLILVEGKCLRVDMGGVEAVVFHGDYFYGGPQAYIVDSLVGYPLMELVWRLLSGEGEEVWAVLSHSHYTFIDYERRIANTGGWTTVPIFEVDRGYGVLLDGEGVQLVKIGG